MPENLQNNPWVLLILALVFAGVIIYVGAAVWPKTDDMRTRIAGLEENITKLNDQVNEGKRLEKMLPQLRQEIRAKEKELETLKKIIPTEAEAHDLIRKLERMAAETTIGVKSFDPQSQAEKEFYFEWPISISVNGSYHSLGMFFAKISNYARIINVVDVSVAADRTGVGRTIRATFFAVTYVYKKDEET